MLREQGQGVPHKFEEISSIFFENNPTSMWIYDLETLCFLAVNNAAIHCYGYSRKEFLEMTLKDIRPSEDIPRLTENISNVTEGLDVAGTWKHKKKDGSNIDVEIISHTINFAGRDAEMVLAHDVTKSKQVEDELSTLNRITQAVNQSHNLKDICKIALDSVIELKYIDIVSIYLVDEVKQVAVLVDYRNYPKEYIKKAAKIPYPKGVTWKVINSGEICNITNPDDEPDLGSAGRALGFRSILGIPIAIENKTIGVFWILSYKEYKLSEAQEHLLTSIGMQIAAAIARANLFNELSKKNRYEEILSSVTRSIHKSINLQDVLENAVESMNKNIDRLDIVIIHLVEDKMAVVKNHRGLTSKYLKKAGSIPFPKGATWKTIIDRKTFYCPDVDKEDVLGPAGKVMGIKSYVITPIVCDGQVKGCLNICSFHKNAFDEEEINLLEIVTQQLGVAITNAEHAEALRKSEKALKSNLKQLSKKNRYEEIVSSIANSVHQSINLQEVFENAVEAMIKKIDFVEYVGIHMAEDDIAVMVAHRGHPKWFVDRVKRIPYPKGFTWATIIEGKLRYCPDVDKDKNIGPAGKEVGIKSYLSMPLKIGDKTLGCINVHSLKKNAFDQEEIRLLGNVANQIETAINNATKAEALRQSEERYRTLFDQSPVGVHIFNKDLKVVQCNSRQAEILGSSRDQIIGLDLNKVKDKGFLRAMKRVFKGKSTREEKMYKATTSNANLWLSACYSPLFDSEGNVTRAMAVVEDISDRKKAEEEIKQLNQDLELKVIERTSQLEATNKELESEVVSRIKADEALQNNLAHLSKMNKYESIIRTVIQNVHQSINLSIYKKFLKMLWRP